MRAPLSVVIPVLDDAGRIGPCLVRLSTAIGDGLIREVILADGGSSDDIAEIAEAAGAELIEGPKGRGRQLAAGANAAGGEWLLFLHADSALDEGWADAVRRHMQSRPDRAGWFRLRFDADGVAPRIVERWANLRAALFGLPYGDQGMLVPRTAYEKAGGFPPIPLMEDAALARRLRWARLDATIVTSAERYRREGWLRRGGRNLLTLARYLAGASPERLAEVYERDPSRRR